MGQNRMLEINHFIRQYLRQPWQQWLAMALLVISISCIAGVYLLYLPQQQVNQLKHDNLKLQLQIEPLVNLTQLDLVEEDWERLSQQAEVLRQRAIKAPNCADILDCADTAKIQVLSSQKPNATTQQLGLLQAQSDTNRLMQFLKGLTFFPKQKWQTIQLSLLATTPSHIDQKPPAQLQLKYLNQDEKNEIQ